MMENDSRDREFKLTNKDFKFLQNLIYKQAGIVLQGSKKDMVYSRLTRRLRVLGLSTFKDYLVFLERDGNQIELNLLTNAITTNLTKFFRESHHMKDFHQRGMAKITQQQAHNDAAYLRVWSAGCSSGEEPYSIAMIMREIVKKKGLIDAKILATDIDTNMLEMGVEGIYGHKSIEDVPGVFKKRYLVKRGSEKFVVGQNLKEMTHFKKLNLMNSWPMKKSFDFIFCRNVMIYFDKESKIDILNRMANLLSDEGILYIGHSESLLHSQDRFKLLGHTIYQKVR